MQTRMIETRPSADSRAWAMLAHLAAVALMGAPFGNVIGPLIVYLVKKDTDPFIADQGKESLNFQITVSIVGFVLFGCYIAGIIVMIATDGKTPWFLFALPLLLLLGVIDLAFVAWACVRAYNGERFRYPLTIRFIK
jgi:uncharacterized Tic20 family protein